MKANASAKSKAAMYLMLTGLTALGTMTPARASTPAKLPQSLDMTIMAAVPLQHDGRWPPLDTVARDLVNSVTGDEFFQGHDPVALLLAWTFDVAAWQDAPLISVANAELRHELQLPEDQTEYSFRELTGHRPLHVLVDELRNMPKGRKPNPLESKVSDIHQKLIVLQEVFTGEALTFIPNPDDPLGAWKPITDASLRADSSLGAVGSAWRELGLAFLADNGPAFSEASKRFASTLQALPAAHRPSADLIATELHYNELHPFRTAWQVMVIGALLSLAAVGVRRRWFDAIAALGMVAGFAVLTYGLSLRWQIAGRIPASNMFESLLFLSWGMGAFAIVSMLVIRHRIVPLTASVMGAIALMLADLLPMNHFIRPIAPVLLDTVWMSIHVPIIMVSYSVLALGVLVAHAQLFTMAIFPTRRKLAATIDSMHYWYIHVGSILLLAGIVTGSMWAASSWGRYWGWDPKEVWSLVALFGYLTILHVRTSQEQIPRWAMGLGALLIAVVLAMIVPKLAPLTPGKVFALGGAVAAMAVFVLARGPFATATKSILAFWMIIMTYVGVNYVLGIGLHSYGFGTGAMVRYMFLMGGADLAFVGLFCLIYLLRVRRAWPAPDTAQAIPVS